MNHTSICIWISKVGPLNKQICNISKYQHIHLRKEIMHPTILKHLTLVFEILENHRVHYIKKVVCNINKTKENIWRLKGDKRKVSLSLCVPSVLTIRYPQCSIIKLWWTAVHVSGNQLCNFHQLPPDIFNISPPSEGKNRIHWVWFFNSHVSKLGILLWMDT